MEKENKDQMGCELVAFLLDLPEDEASFLAQCFANEVCCSLIEEMMPRLVKGNDTKPGVLSTIAVYGALDQKGYETAVEHYKKNILTKWDKRFLTLVEQLRAILKPEDESENECDE